MQDEKYIVFKREGSNSDAYIYATGDALEDAVVIRTSDVFASGVLWGYVHAAQTAIEILHDVLPEVDLVKLASIRDYFADRAREADDAKSKLPTP
jgi:hypothetical protein